MTCLHCYYIIIGTALFCWFMWNFVASWHRYICFYIRLISILLITYIIYTRFSMQNSARQTVSRMYMPFLNDLKILPANPAQNFFLHTISLCLHLQIQKEFYGFFKLIFCFFLSGIKSDRLSFC